MSGMTAVLFCTLTLTVTPPVPPHYDGYGLRTDGPEVASYTVITSLDHADVAPRVDTFSRNDGWYVPLPGVTKATTTTVTVYTTNNGETCRGETSFVLPVYDKLASVAGRLIVPGAGKTDGAFGSHWKTSLRLRGQGKGTIYFRRQGTFAGDASDPSLTYDLGPGGDEGPHGILYFDDLLGAMHESGVGVLDVVPEGHFAPIVEAYVYNDSEHGKFGTDLPVLRPEQMFDALEVPLDASKLAGSRINIGLRTFEEDVAVDVQMSAGGLTSLRTFTVPANTFVQMPLEEVMGRAFDPETDQTLRLDFGSRPMAAYYSVNDNTSSDPRVYAGQDSPLPDVSAAVLPR